MGANNPNLTRKTLVLAVTEDSVGTPEVMTAFEGSGTTGSSSAAMLIFDEINPISMDATVVDVAPVRASLSKYKNLIGRRLYNIRPKTHLMASRGISRNPKDENGDGIAVGTSNVGDADNYITGTGEAIIAYQSGSTAPFTNLVSNTNPQEINVPFYGSLFRACGLKEAITLGVQSNTQGQVAYTPRSSDFESCTMHVYADKIKHVSSSVFGTFTLSGNAGEGAELQFDMRGTYNLPTTATTVPTPTYPKDNKKLIQAGVSANSEAGWSIGATNGDGTGGFVAGDPIVRSFTFDAGVNVIERMDANSQFGLQGLFITDRTPTLELVVEVESDLATASDPGGNNSIFNPMSDLADASGEQVRHEIKFIHGDDGTELGSFEKIGFLFPAAQLVDVQYADDQGIRTYTLSYNITSDLDDRDYGIVFGASKLTNLTTTTFGWS